MRAKALGLPAEEDRIAHGVSARQRSLRRLLRFGLRVKLRARLVVGIRVRIRVRLRLRLRARPRASVRVRLIRAAAHSPDERSASRTMLRAPFCRRASVAPGRGQRSAAALPPPEG